MERIIEVDGPQQAYFEITDIVGDIKRRTTYRTLALCSYDPDLLVKKLNEDLDVIRTAIIDGGIIYWRIRPEVKQDYDTGMFSFYCRLATAPEISEGVWGKTSVKKEAEKMGVIG